MPQLCCSPSSLVRRGLLCFHGNCMLVWYSVSLGNAIGILIGIALSLLISLGSMDILTMLILPIYTHEMSFYLQVSSLFESLLCATLISPKAYYISMCSH